MIGNVLAETKYEQERLGCFTASEISKLHGVGTRKMTPDELKAREKGNRKTTIEDETVFTQGAETYIRIKLAELLTGKYRKLEGIHALEHGNETEPDAVAELRKTYPDLIYYGNEDRKFFQLTRLSGGTPDGVDEVKRLVAEIKCPESNEVHVSYLLLKDSQELKSERPDYWHQLQMNMVCVAKSLGVEFEKMKGVFVSYSNDFDPEYRIKIIEVLPEIGYEERLLGILKRAEKKLSDMKDNLG